MSKLLTMVINDLINGRAEQAEVSIHEYFVKKVQDSMVNESDSTQRPMTIKTSLTKLVKPAIASLLGCSVTDLLHIKSEEFGTVSATMKTQYAEMEKLSKQGKTKEQRVKFQQIEEAGDDAEDAEEAEWAIWVHERDGIKFAAFGFDDGWQSITTEYMVKKADLKALMAAAKTLAD
jgi:hypothetical protein